MIKEFLTLSSILKLYSEIPFCILISPSQAQLEPIHIIDLLNKQISSNIIFPLIPQF